MWTTRVPALRPAAADGTAGARLPRCRSAAHLDDHAARPGCTLAGRRARGRVRGADRSAHRRRYRRCRRASVRLWPTARACPRAGAGRCDGANSAVAKALFGRAHDPARIGFGLEVELPRARPGAGPSRSILAGDRLGLWLGLSQGGSLTLGVGGVHRRNADLRAASKASQRRHGADLAGLRCKGAFLPFGEVRPIPRQGRVLLAGDAAGLVDPITGEGIAWAMKSGQLARASRGRGIGPPGAPDAALGRYAPQPAPDPGRTAPRAGAARLVYQPRLQPAFLRLLVARAGLAAALPCAAGGRSGLCRSRLAGAAASGAAGCCAAPALSPGAP